MIEGKNDLESRFNDDERAPRETDQLLNHVQERIASASGSRLSGFLFFSVFSAILSSFSFGWNVGGKYLSRIPIPISSHIIIITSHK